MLKIHFHWCITVLGLFVQCYFDSSLFWYNSWYKQYLCFSFCASPSSYHNYIDCSFSPHFENQLSVLCQLFVLFYYGIHLFLISHVTNPQVNLIVAWLPHDQLRSLSKFCATVNHSKIWCWPKGHWEQW